MTLSANGGQLASASYDEDFDIAVDDDNKAFSWVYRYTRTNNKKKVPWQVNMLYIYKKQAIFCRV